MTQSIWPRTIAHHITSHHITRFLLLLTLLLGIVPGMISSAFANASDYNYSLSSDGSSLIATPTSGTGDTYTLTLKAPESTFYGDGKTITATLEGIEGFKNTGWNGAYSKINYKDSSNINYPSGTDRPGDFTITIDIQNVNYKTYTLSLKHTIAPKEVTLTWGSTEFSCDKQSHVPTVTLQAMYT